MITKVSRRALLKSTAGSALLAAVGMPAIVRAQADAIRIGHLTPITGFLGPLGEYAVIGIKLAAEEINATGGVMGRKIELVMEDSVNPQTASAKAERLIGLYDFGEAQRRHVEGLIDRWEKSRGSR